VAAALAEHDAVELALETLASAAVSAPKDAPLLTQLADLQLHQHQLAAARNTLRRAQSIDANYDNVADRLVMIERILVLDPTQPGLRLVPRTRRSRLVLTAVLDEIHSCAAAPGVAPVVEEARRHLRRPTRASAEAAEQDLELAARVWEAAPCHGSGPEARALAYVLDRVAREAQS
jgi:hypothetical protein